MQPFLQLQETEAEKPIEIRAASPPLVILGNPVLCQRDWLVRSVESGGVPSLGNSGPGRRTQTPTGTCSYRVPYNSHNSPHTVSGRPVHTGPFDAV